MQIYAKSRSHARSMTCGKMRDNGPDAPAGKRYSRDISQVGSGTAKPTAKPAKRVIIDLKATASPWQSTYPVN